MGGGAESPRVGGGKAREEEPETGKPWLVKKRRSQHEGPQQPLASIRITSQEPLGGKSAPIETPKPDVPGRATVNAHREAAQLCAEHVRQLGGASPLHNLMEVKC